MLCGIWHRFLETTFEPSSAFWAEKVFAIHRSCSSHWTPIFSLFTYPLNLKWVSSFNTNGTKEVRDLLSQPDFNHLQVFLVSKFVHVATKSWAVKNPVATKQTVEKSPVMENIHILHEYKWKVHKIQFY